MDGALRERFRSRVKEVVGAALASRAQPPELRDRLEAVRRETEEALATAGEVPADFREELERFVEREVTAYTAKVRPAPSFGSIFANARASAVRYQEKQEVVDTKKCPTCGAARPEGTNLRVCSLCGNGLFPASKPGS